MYNIFVKLRDPSATVYTQNYLHIAHCSKNEIKLCCSLDIRESSIESSSELLKLIVIQIEKNNMLAL